MKAGSFRWAGRLRLVLRGSDGCVKRVVEGRNFITDAGREWAADRLSDADMAAASHIGIGDGSGQAVDDTTLANETARVALTGGYPDQGTGADKYTILFYANVPAGTGTGTVSEVALFNAASSGTMINYVDTFTPIDKAAGDDLDIELEAEML